MESTQPLTKSKRKRVTATALNPTPARSRPKLLWHRGIVLVCLMLLPACQLGAEAIDIEEDTPVEDMVLVATSQLEPESQPIALAGSQRVYINFDGPLIADCDGYCSDAIGNRSWAIGGSLGQ